MPENNPHTWADGFGIWHASVPLSGFPLSDALAARKLIIAELEQREGPNFDPRTVHVTRERLSSVPGHVIYCERNATSL